METMMITANSAKTAICRNICNMTTALVHSPRAVRHCVCLVSSLSLQYIYIYIYIHIYTYIPDQQVPWDPRTDELTCFPHFTHQPRYICIYIYINSSILPTLSQPATRLPSLVTPSASKGHPMSISKKNTVSLSAICPKVTL